jgi:hypothetical protein
VIERLSSGTPGRYLSIVSSTRSFPCISSLRIAAAVNCFVIEPIVETVSGA